MRVWIAIWTGSAIITRGICGWIGRGATPRLIGLFVAAGFIKGLPRTTAIVALLALGWLATAITLGLQLDNPDDEEAEPSEASAGETAAQAPASATETTSGAPREPSRELVVETLHSLLEDTGGVHLKALAQALPKGIRTTGQARSLLASHSIRVRPGVRGPGGGVREGVHRDDIPPRPHPAEDTVPVADVAAGQGNNNNGNNSAADEEPGGGIVQDEANPNRWHVLQRRPRAAARASGKDKA
jgi:preprotein translocase subunit SecG